MSGEFFLVADAATGFDASAQEQMIERLRQWPHFIVDRWVFLFRSEAWRQTFVDGGAPRSSDFEIHPAVWVDTTVTLSTVGGDEDLMVRDFAEWCQTRWPCRLDGEGARKALALDELLWFRSLPPSTPPPAPFPEERTLDGGRYVIGAALYGGPERGIYEVRRVGDGETAPRHWMTLSQKQLAPVGTLRQQFALELPGVAPLRYIGPIVDESTEHDGLIEELPDGERTDDWPPEGRDAIVAALALSEVLAAAHRQGAVLYGIRPETVFVIRSPEGRRFSGIAPRCERFWLTARPARDFDPPAFDYFYFPAEVLSGGPPTSASDVFSFCATVAHWVSLYPFVGESMPDRFAAVFADERAPWTGRASLATLKPLLDRGLARDPAQRPSSAQLVEELRSLLRADHG